MIDDHSHCRYLLHGARRFAKENRVKVPAKITALRCDARQFFIEADGGVKEYVKGHCAFDAKANFIYSLVKIGEQCTTTTTD